LLDKDYLSLAEVQVMGVDPLHFSEVDYSSAQNDFGGVNNAPNYANMTAFALPHTLIEPLRVRAAKALLLE
jgi:hypothetical protein